MRFFSGRDDTLEELNANLCRDLQLLEERMKILASRVAQLEQTPPSMIPADIKGRVEDLELWRGKVHKMLVEVSAAGNEKLTKRGRGFAAIYGK